MFKKTTPLSSEQITQHGILSRHLVDEVDALWVASVDGDCRDGNKGDYSWSPSGPRGKGGDRQGGVLDKHSRGRKYAYMHKGGIRSFSNTGTHRERERERGGERERETRARTHARTHAHTDNNESDNELRHSHKVPLGHFEISVCCCQRFVVPAVSCSGKVILVIGPAIKLGISIFTGTRAELFPRRCEKQTPWSVVVAPTVQLMAC